ncbi:MAG: hypothetical protein R6X23_16115 [Acidimicrobiia bacterium]
MSAAPPLGVSIFLPTHVRGREVRQDPIRLKKLTNEARTKLSAAGLTSDDVEAFVQPAATLIDEHAFWQHSQEGLALFLDGGEARSYQVPLPLPERVIVGPGFHVKPLLPMLEVDGAFLVLTLTANRVQLFDASRFALAADTQTALPRGIGDVSQESDYENPVQASPVARPHTASINVTNAQVYGDSPTEWRKDQLVELARSVAQAVDHRVVVDPVPVVLVADAEIGGHFQKYSKLGHLLAGFIRTNPAAMDLAQLHGAAYDIIKPRLELRRREAVERLAALVASRDARAVTGIEELTRAAYQGIVETLLLVEDETAWGRYDEATGEVATGDAFAATGDDLLEAAAVQTLRHGGDVRVLPAGDPWDAAPAAAILRY